MSLVHYQPWHSAGQLHDQVNQLFNRQIAGATKSRSANEATSTDWAPKVDIKETKTEFIIQADIPGVNPADIEINAENGHLIVKGKRELEKTTEQDDYTRVERQFGEFYRRFTLPDTANTDGISAKSENGVLQINIPKNEKLQPRKIKIEH